MGPRIAVFRRMVAAAALLSGGFATLVGTAQDGPSEQPNLVVIMADDLGCGDLSCYDGWIKTPQIDALAEQGLRLTDFHSSGAVCSPTRAGLLTGRYQQRAGIPGVVYADPGRVEHEHGLQPVEVTFAELLRDAGYRTAIFGKWHLGYRTKYNPLHHGFDAFHGYVSGNIDYFSHVDQAGNFDWWQGLRREDERGYSTYLITRHAVDFIERCADAQSPFCLYVAHEAPHYPFQGPEDEPFRHVGDPAPRQRLEDDAIRRAYDEMVVAMDQGVGQIVKTLQARGLAERTLVLFFSDNGAARFGSNAPWRGSKGSVWEGGHRVPCIAWWPGTTAPGRVSDHLTITLDVMPTLLELAGVPATSERPLDGRSFAALLRAEKPSDVPPRQDPLFWRHADQCAMRQGTWKLVANMPPDDTQTLRSPQLFDLRSDPGEEHDLSKVHPDRLEAMKKALKAWYLEVIMDSTPQPFPPDRVP